MKRRFLMTSLMLAALAVLLIAVLAVGILRHGGYPVGPYRQEMGTGQWEHEEVFRPLQLRGRTVSAALTETYYGGYAEEKNYELTTVRCYISQDGYTRYTVSDDDNFRIEPVAKNGGWRYLGSDPSQSPDSKSMTAAARSYIGGYYKDLSFLDKWELRFETEYYTDTEYVCTPSFLTPEGVTGLRYRVEYVKYVCGLSTRPRVSVIFDADGNIVEYIDNGQEIDWAAAEERVSYSPMMLENGVERYYKGLDTGLFNAYSAGKLYYAESSIADTELVYENGRFCLLVRANAQYRRAFSSVTAYSYKGESLLVLLE